MNGIAEILQEFAAAYGYPGVFLISLVGSVIPFLPLPYLAAVVFLSGSSDPLLLGLAAGAGGAVGKIASYYLGRLGYLASGEANKKNLDAIRGMVTRYGMIGVFIFAVTPLPDDMYVVPMGIARLPFWRFFLANLAGKALLSVLVAYAGRAYFSYLTPFLGEESILLLLSVVVITAGASIVIARSDWILAIEIARTRGMRGVISNLRRILRLG